MKWRIIFARTAEKELAKLSSEMQLRLGRAIRSLENNPIPAISAIGHRREVYR